MTDAAESVYRATFAYAWGVYGGNLPGADIERVKGLAADYAAKALADVNAGASPQAVLAAFAPTPTTTPEGPHYR